MNESSMYAPVKRFTISDHVREMHEGGTSVEQICWKLQLHQETVERWLKASA